MLYAVATVPAFALFCFIIGLPIARLLLANANKNSQLLIAPAFGFSALVVVISIALDFAGPIRGWWWAAWLLAGLSAVAMIAIKFREATEEPTQKQFLPANKINLLASAFGIVAIFAMLIALPLIGDVSYAVFRTNPSDADVNITLADAWVNASRHDIRSYVASIGTAQQAPETLKLVADAPLSIFSARFIGMEVRLSTSMMIGLYGEMFRLPPYLAYLPFMLATAGIAAITIFGMLRTMGASTWFSLIIAASLIGGWAYMVRESDNNNQHATLPALVAALYILYLRFDGGWKSGPIRAGAALGLTFAAAITPYPEIGIAFCGAIGAALVIGGAIRRASLSHWITIGITVVASLLLLTLNGQALILSRWIAVAQSGALDLGSFTGPTGEYIEAWGVVGFAGLPRMPFANVLLPYYAWALLAGCALIVVAWSWRSFTGLAVLIYTAGICGIGAYGMYAADTPYVAYRAASFLGFVAVFSCAAVLYASVKTEGAPVPAVSLLKKPFLLGATIFLTIGVLAGTQFWAGSFTQPHKGYSMLSRRDFKSNVYNLTDIRRALHDNAGQNLAVYLPPMSAGTVPWWSTLNVYMTAGQFNAAYLSGLMHDNKDARYPVRNQMYGSAEAKARPITLLLVDGVHNPVPKQIEGELIAADKAHLLYRIAPTPISRLMEILPEPPSQ